jgi:hypothetical protein
MLSQLTDVKLKSVGMDDKEDRKLILTAVRKAGYVPKKKSTSPEKKAGDGISGETIATGGSSDLARSTAVQVAVGVTDIFLAQDSMVTTDHSKEEAQT